MLESERGGVQEWPFEMGDRANVSTHATMDAAVQRIANYRMADGAQVNANLVRAPCEDGDARESKDAAKVFRGHNSSYGLATSARAPALAVLCRDRRHPFSVRRISSNRFVNPAAGLDFSPHQRDIRLVDFALPELPRELFMGGIVLRHDHETRRAAIQPMDDPGPLLAANAAQVSDVMQERVDERAVCMASGGMDDHSSRFVDNQQVTILVDDVNGQRFRRWRGIDRLGNIDRDDLSGLDQLIRSRCLPADLNMAVFDQALQLRPRVSRNRGHEKQIEPDPVAVC